MEPVLIVLCIVAAPKDQVSHGYEAESRPLWLKTAVDYNVEHANRYHHKLVVQQVDPLPFRPHQTQRCDALVTDNIFGEKVQTQLASANKKQRENCYASYNRENCTWYKFHAILKLLRDKAAEFVLFVDVDAIIVTRPNHDTVTHMIEVINAHKMDIMVADEDWRDGGKGGTNTGVILARNTQWTVHWFEEMVAMEANRTCGTNEQACFKAFYSRNSYGAKDHIVVTSGSIWNQHPRLGVDTAEIVHFMGGAKQGLENIDVPVAGDCGTDRVCVDVGHCAARTIPTSAGGRPKWQPFTKMAFVTAHALQAPPGHRFTEFREMKALLTEAKALGAAAVLLVPPPDQARHPLTTAETEVLTRHGYTIQTVDWVAPPGLSASLPGPESCAGQGYLPLHALGLTAYQSVVVYDPHVLVKTGVASLLQCAGQNRVMASAGKNGPLAPGFFAVKPSRQLLAAAIKFASAAFWEQTSWDTDGVGARDCSLGLMWTLFFGARPDYRAEADAAFTTSGTVRPTAMLLDRCEWNRMPGDDAGCVARNSSCDGAKAVHRGSCLGS